MSVQPPAVKTAATVLVDRNYLTPNNDQAPKDRASAPTLES
jgi:hypothetical protein